MFTDKEIEYLDSQRLGRLATVTTKNQAHVVPTGFRVSDDRTAIEVGGHNLSARRPLYLRNIETNPWVAYVVDDVASTNPWTPRGVTVRGSAEIRAEGGERLGPGPRLHPDRDHPDPHHIVGHRHPGVQTAQQPQGRLTPQRSAVGGSPSRATT